MRAVYTRIAASESLVLVYSRRSGAGRNHNRVARLATREPRHGFHVLAWAVYKLWFATLKHTNLDANTVLPSRAVRMICAHITARLFIIHIRELIAEQRVICEQRIRLRAAWRMLVAETIARCLICVQAAMVVGINVLITFVVCHLNDM